MLKRNPNSLKRSGTSLKRGTGLKAKPRSKEKITQDRENSEKMWALFNTLWDGLKEKKCWSCSIPIWGENKNLYWHHLCPKNKYPDIMYEPENLYFCCWECHSKTEVGYPPIAIQLATEIARKRFNV